MNDQQKKDQDSGVRDQEIRAALDQHWAASDANDFETEHRIYLEDAVLEYPQSGERTRGRSNIQNQRASQPSNKRFSIRRIIGSGDLWITEFILTYDSKPSYTVSIMEFKGDKVARETQYFADPFQLPHSALNGSNGWTHNIEAQEQTHPRWRGERWIKNGWSSLRYWVAVIWNNMPSCWFAFRSACSSPSPGQKNCFLPAAQNLFTRRSSRPKSRFPPDGLFRVGCRVRFRIFAHRGFFSSPASVALMIDMIVATLTSTIATVPKGLSRLNWLDDLLYLPEVLYVLFFIWLICSGPGRFSVDYWLAGKLLR